MCERCEEIDRQLARYRKLKQGVTDKQALEALASLIADLGVQKAHLHPNPER